MEKNYVGLNSNCSFRVVLFQPEIPANTGNIGRICVGMNADLHIIKPMRFLLTDKYLKRAGLDYWKKLTVFFHEDFDNFINLFPENNIYYCTTKSTNIYTERKFKQGDIFIFGPETQGIPESILNKYSEQNISIPMTHKIRSVNLSNSVAIILYEAWRQIGFDV